MPAAVFGKTVGLFAFFGLTVALLHFSVGLETACNAACITTISLSTPAALTYTKSGVAPATKFSDQLQNPALKIAGV